MSRKHTEASDSFTRRHRTTEDSEVRVSAECSKADRSCSRDGGPLEDPQGVFAQRSPQHSCRGRSPQYTIDSMLRWSIRKLVGGPNPAAASESEFAPNEAHRRQQALQENIEFFIRSRSIN
eukprot:GHVU01048319.1.p2 GENE.GHVU01048319.1~~GHVU01048319.1.p2  ORF type:complete len:121 (+),score=12.40 GHVU01048319.1:516-878(+)